MLINEKKLNTQLFSHLPNRVLKVISLAGIPVDRDLGMKMLHRSIDDLTDCYRSKTTGFVLCIYSFYVEQFFGN